MSTEGFERLGRYRLMELLATGGMGEVFLARQEGPAGFAKTVVIKRILRHLANDQGFIDLFLDEARLAAQLTHPNIVQIYELGHEDGAWFIAMEYVHGPSLRAVCQRLASQNERMPPEIAARICAQALSGLHHAHTLTDDRGRPLHLIHRDVSPDNVLVGFTGVVKLVDFGIARAGTAAAHSPQGGLKGKEAYLAPELLEGREADARADLYSMGVLLEELVFPPGGGLAPAPKELREVATQAKAHDPAHRFRSAEVMAAALEMYIAGTGGPMTEAHVTLFLKNLFGADSSSASPTTQPWRGGSAQAPKGTAVIPTDRRPVVDGDSRDLRLRPSDERTELHHPPRESLAPGGPPAREAEPARDGAQKSQRFASRGTWVILAGAGLGLGVLAAVGIGASLGRSERVEPAAPALAPPQETARDAGAPVALSSPEDPPADPPELPTEPRADPPESSTSPLEPTQAARKRRPPLARPGKVLVRVNPYAEVFYGGRSLGFTPLAPVEVPPGVAYFLLRNRQLGITRRVMVKVPAGGEVVLKADLFDAPPR